MKIKKLISVKIEIFFSHAYYMYIFRLFLSYIVLNRSFLYIFVTNIHIYQPGLTPRRAAEAPGPRALRAGRRQAEAPGPALCRPVAIHTRLGVGRAGSHRPTSDGSAEAPGPALCRPVAIHTKLGVGRAGRQPASTDRRVTGRLKPRVNPKPKNL